MEISSTDKVSRSQEHLKQILGGFSFNEDFIYHFIRSKQGYKLIILVLIVLLIISVYFLSYKTILFFFQNSLEDLDPACRMGLDPWCRME